MKQQPRRWNLRSIDCLSEFPRNKIRCRQNLQPKHGSTNFSLASSIDFASFFGNPIEPKWKICGDWLQSLSNVSIVHPVLQISPKTDIQSLDCLDLESIRLESFHSAAPTIHRLWAHWAENSRKKLRLPLLLFYLISLWRGWCCSWWRWHTTQRRRRFSSRLAYTNVFISQGLLAELIM